MGKKMLLIIGLIIVLAIIAIISQSVLQKPAETRETLELQLSGHSYEVEIADIASEQSLGLANRPTIGDYDGMIFLFPEARTQSFWMKGMQFPLDIIWIAEDKVIGFEQDAPPHTSGTPKVYFSPEPANMVLEVAAGTVFRDNIQVGDIIDITK